MPEFGLFSAEEIAAKAARPPMHSRLPSQPERHLKKLSGDQRSSAGLFIERLADHMQEQPPRRRPQGRP